jgi:very-short-patch-repair endonuclease
MMDLAWCDVVVPGNVGWGWGTIWNIQQVIKIPESIYRTCLEKQMFGYLTNLGFESGIDYYEQYPVGSYVLDFAFVQFRRPPRGVDIETDGVMWHSSAKQRQRDGYRTYKLHKAGWITERFGEVFTCEDVAAVLEKHGLKPSL